jgi:hypothetical protein
LTETAIASEPEAEMDADMYGDNVVYTVSDGGEHYIYMLDLGDSATWTNPRVITESGANPEIWGDNIVYEGDREGYDLTLVFNLESNREYDLIERDERICAYEPRIWENLVIMSVGTPVDLWNIGLVNLDDELFDEHLVMLTNDTNENWLLGFHENKIVYLVDEAGGDWSYDVYMLEIIEVTQGEEVVEVDEIETVYNQDWIYFSYIMIAGLIALVVVYYSEYMM